MLSDACADFLYDLEKKDELHPRGLVCDLIKDALWYGRPPFDYGPEREILIAAADTYLDASSKSDTDAGIAELAHLKQIAKAVRAYLDSQEELPPFAEYLAHRAA
jgi:hypothetical protein